MKIHSFIVSLAGDPDTAHFGGIAKISFDDPYVYDNDMIMAAKEALAHLYDCPISRVYTEEDYWNLRIAAKEKINPSATDLSLESQ